MNIKSEMKKLRQQRAFITVKDHKHGFPNSLELQVN